MHPDILAARDEGINFGVVDDHDLDIARLHAGRFDQRGGHIRHERFGFGIAQDALRQRGARDAGKRQGRERDEFQPAPHQR